MMKNTVWYWFRKVVFLFDAEGIHERSSRMLAFLGRSAPGRLLLRAISGARISGVFEADTVHLGKILLRNPIGLAAGFDKEGKIIAALPHLGFGFVEVGTVTPRPQPGNAKPRLFRDPERFSLFNRMGFNSPGAEVVARNIATARSSGSLPKNFRIGVNIGKNKETPTERAHEDYAAAVVPFRGLADYFVVNVSSPNTPGLRDLQTVETLCKIVSSVREAMLDWKGEHPPVFLKLAPELEGGGLEELLRNEEKIGVDGWVLTNTLAGFWKGGRGGWSGGALGSLARERLELARAKSKLPIISVGGILQAREMLLRLRDGADAVQVYTGWIYFGPSWVPHLLRRMRKAHMRKPA